MTYQEKCDAFVKEMTGYGLATGTAFPPIYKLWGCLGLHFAPPLFQRSGELVVTMGFPFSVLFCAAMYLFQWRAQGIPLVVVFLFGLLGAVGFGVGLGLYYRRLGSKYVIPSWGSYQPGSITRVG